VGDPTSRKSAALRQAIEPLMRFYAGDLYQKHARRPGICVPCMIKLGIIVALLASGLARHHRRP